MSVGRPNAHGPSGGYMAKIEPQRPVYVSSFMRKGHLYDVEVEESRAQREVSCTEGAFPRMPV